MHIGNITSNNFNLDVTGKDIQIEVYEQLIGQLQQENKQLREKVNKFNIDKINNENKSLKGSCKILGEKNNNQRKELQRLNNKIEKLKVINEEHKKLNGELREENQKYKEVIDKAINDLNIIIDIVQELPLGSDCWIIDRLEANKSILKEAE